MNRHYYLRCKNLFMLLVLLTTFLLPQSDVNAATAMTVQPITWNVVGLDSNNVAVGPNKFPVAVRACNPASNTISLTDVEADFVWLTGGTTTNDDYIKLRPLSLDPIQPNPQIDLAPGACTDFYFEIEVTRTPDSYNKTRRYRIDVSYNDADFVDRQVVSTVTPREIFVEKLVSQNRNATVNMRLDGVGVPVGGTMSLMLGQTYTITLDANTATNGYEQIESFIHFPNTIFQVLNVNTTYSADSSAYVDNPNDKLYGDSCKWENDPNSPNYRSCLDVGKNGGTVTVAYTIKIIGGGGTSDSLNSLIYDFSGSSYHYNSDYSSSFRLFSIIGPSSVTISKRFLPDAIAPAGTSTLSITLTNPTTTTISGVNFTDPLPAGMVVASPTGASTTSCGTPTFAPAANDTSLSFSNGTIAPNSNCTIKVNVTVPSAGTYDNLTNHLYIDDTVDTGNSASASLNAGTSTTCTSGQTLVTWTFPTGSSPTAPLYTSKATQVATAVSSTTTGTPQIDTNVGNPAPSWSGQGFSGGAYFQFQVDRSKYSDVKISFGRIQTNASWNAGAAVTVSSSTDGSSFSSIGSGTLTSAFTNTQFDVPAGASYIRISATGAQNTNSRLAIDNVVFTGCLINDPPPTITKSFVTDPIIAGGNSTLTFNIQNTNVAAVNLTGVTFTDALPGGLKVATPANASTTCLGSPTWAPAANDTTLTFGSPTGATMAAGSSCTVSVDITGTTPGLFENVSGYISSTQSGANKTAGGFATDTLLVVAPPVISKSFAQTTILTGASTNLSFTINNPNLTTALSGIGFADTLPGGLTVADSSSAQCGGTLTTTAATGVIQLSGGSLTAPNGSCTFSVPVTGTTAGTKNNVTSAVTSTEGGNGNTASATMYVKDASPQLKVLKQIGLTSNVNGVWSKFQGISSLPTNVYYKFTVENTGDVNLTDVSITDSTLTTAGVDLSGCTWANLTTADPIQVCLAGPLNVSAGGTLHNTATANGSYGVTPVASDPSSATYGTYGLTLDKSASPVYFSAAGNTISYSYQVTNSGYVPLYGPVTVSDDKVTVSCPAVTTVGDGDNYLDPADYPAGSGSTAESLTCTATYTVISDDVTAGSVTNTASASIDGITSNQDSVLATLATLTIDKDVSPTSVSADDTVTYTVVVVNTGATNLTNLQLTDTLPFASGEFSVTNVGATVTSGSINTNSGFDGETDTDLLAGTDTLVVGATATITITVALNDAAPGTYDNTASVSTTQTGAVDDDGTLADDPGTPGSGADPEDDEDVTVVGYPDLNLLKSNGTSLVPAGGTTTYELTVSNDGNASSSGVITVVDVLPGGMSVTNGTLTLGGANSADWSCTAGGDVITCTSSVIIAAADSSVFSFPVGVDVDATGTQLNKVQVGGGGDPTNSSAPTEITAGQCTAADDPNEGCAVDSDGLASIELTKTGTLQDGGDGQADAGDTITYAFTVTNTGTVTLTNISLADTVGGVTISGSAIASLDPGASDSTTYTGSYTLTQADINSGSFTNTATATGTPPSGPDVSDPDSDTQTLTAAPALTLDKTSTTADYSAVGDSLSYSYEVTNSGNVSLAGPVTISDDIIGSINPCGDLSTVGNLDANLDPGESVTCTASYTVDQDDLNVGSVTNTASATADGTTSPTDSVTINADQNPALTLDKTTTTADYDSVGDTLSYSYEVTNSGNISLAGPVTISDDIIGSINPCGDLSTVGNLDGNLDPGESVTCTASYTVDQDDLNAGSVTNTASATADGTTSPTDSVTINADQNPALTLDKTSTTADYSAVGDSLSYSYEVTNSGNVSLAGPVTISDDIIGSINPCGDLSTVGNLDGNLDPGESVTCTATHTVTQTNLNDGSVTNTASATADGTTSPTDSVTINADQNPVLTLDKTSTTADYDSVGDTLSYSYEVTNSGNISLAGPVTISDDIIGSINPCGDLSTVGNLDGNLDPGESVTCTASYTVDQDDLNAGSVTNTASATADGTTSPTDSVTINADQNPALSLDKTSTTADYSAVGDSLSYSYEVTNSGNVSLAGPVTISDDIIGSINPCGDLSTVGNLDANLDPGESVTCTASYTVDQDDLNAGSVTNTASATADGTTSPTDSVTINADQNPALTLDKTGTLNDGGDGQADAGDTITYAFTVTNTGNVILNNITIADTVGGVTISGSMIASLAPGASDSTTYTGSYTLTQADINTGSFTNTATATGTPPSGPDVSDPDGDTQTFTAAPDLGLSKTNGVNLVNAGGTTTYTLTLSNSGNIATSGLITIVDVLPGGMSVTDGMLTLSGTNAGDWSCAALSDEITCTSTSTIAPSGTSEFEFTVNVDSDASGTQDNRAQVGGGGDPTNPTAPTSGTAGQCTDTDIPNEGCAVDSDTVVAINIIKTITSITFDSPTLLRMVYSLEVENPGVEDLTSLQVTDDLSVTFAVADSFSVEDLSSVTLSVNSVYDGDADGGTNPAHIELLDGTDTLTSGSTAIITLEVLVDTGGRADMYTNTATVTGTPPSGPDIQATDIISGPSFIDPAVTKSASPSLASVGEIVTFTISLFNNGTVTASNVVVTDTLPDNLDYVSATSIDTTTSFPRGTISVTPPRTIRVDIGDLAVTDVIEITIVTRVNSLGLPPVENEVTVEADPPPAGVFPDPVQNNIDAVVIQVVPSTNTEGVSFLPVTGFAPDQYTVLPVQHADQMYTELGDFWLEIPDQGIKMPIVGVPITDGEWHVDWLWNQAGWLNGTAFPTWQGNSVITGHVYLPNGLPGPFIDLGKLRWGSKIIVHAFGESYVYEVRSSRVLLPTDLSVIKHEEKPWLTLLTCKGYDETSEEYRYRVAVRAILIEVNP